MKKTKIEWCDSTWNPVTGCLHGCEYCYARRIAERFADKNHLTYVDGVKPSHLKNIPYPYGFYPTFHPDRLEEPAKMTKPRNIFVCSMADLFGEWVPDKWIEKVFSACEDAPQHNYLFLTKNPKRYEKVLDRYFPPNMWFGWSQDGPVGGALNHETHHSIQSFVSLEPFLRPFETMNIRGVDWVIIGAETGNRKGKVIPQKEWIDKIVHQCKECNVPVFMKDSLIEIMGDEFIQEIPEGLKI